MRGCFLPEEQRPLWPRLYVYLIDGGDVAGIVKEHAYGVELDCLLSAMNGFATKY
jgi:hypothetical protein